MNITSHVWSEVRCVRFIKFPPSALRRGRRPLECIACSKAEQGLHNEAPGGWHGWVAVTVSMEHWL